MGNETRTLWLSIATGLFAVFLVFSYSQEKKAEIDKKYGNTLRVAVAAIDISEMQTIDDTMLDFKSVPEEYVNPGHIKDLDSIIGQVAGTPIKKGEQILMQKLLTPGPETGIALQVSPGKRAVTLPVDEVRGVAKLIRPGDRIDILAAMDVGRGIGAKKEVALLMQDVTVLATGVSVVNNLPRMFEVDPATKNVMQTALTGDTKFNTITIEADPKQAQDLIFILATSPGNLFYTLRNPNDRKMERLPSSTLETVIGRPLPENNGNYNPPTAPTMQRR